MRNVTTKIWHQKWRWEVANKSCKFQHSSNQDKTQYGNILDANIVANIKHDDNFSLLLPIYTTLKPLHHCCEETQIFVWL